MISLLLCDVRFCLFAYILSSHNNWKKNLHFEAHTIHWLAFVVLWKLCHETTKSRPALRIESCKINKSIINFLFLTNSIKPRSIKNGSGCSRSMTTENYSQLFSFRFQLLKWCARFLRCWHSVPRWSWLNDDSHFRIRALALIEWDTPLIAMLVASHIPTSSAGSINRHAL